MDKVYFLYDVGPQSRLEWLANAFHDKEVKWLAMKYNYKNRIYRWRKPLQFFSYLNLASRAIRESGKGDYIISWNFIIGAFLACMCHFLNLRRSILSLNMISHPKSGLIGKIRKKVYNYAFSYPAFYFTVNSQETLSAYLEEYKIDKSRVRVLPDAYLPVYKEKAFNDNEGYIFCGGEAQRDWNAFFYAARKFPEYNFVGVARKKYMPKEMVVPKNVTMYYDIEEEVFDKMLEEACMVTLPLLSTMPAGLIVMFKSIFLSKPLITSKTSSIQNYLQDGKDALLIEIGDVDGFYEGIKKILSDKEYAKALTESAKQSIKEFSPEGYSKRIYNILFGVGK